ARFERETQSSKSKLDATQKAQESKKQQYDEQVAGLQKELDDLRQQHETVTLRTLEGERTDELSRTETENLIAELEKMKDKADRKSEESEKLLEDMGKVGDELQRVKNEKDILENDCRESKQHLTEANEMLQTMSNKKEQADEK